MANTFFPITMYGYEVIVPKDGKYSVNDENPEYEFMEDEYENDVPDDIGDMFLNNSKIGYYFGNIPDVSLQENCGMCLLLTDGTVAESETRAYYINGHYGIFLGVIITPEMTISDVSISFNQLREQIETNECLKKLDLDGPIFISGVDVSELLS